MWCFGGLGCSFLIGFGRKCFSVRLDRAEYHALLSLDDQATPSACYNPLLSSYIFMLSSVSGIVWLKM